MRPVNLAPETAHMHVHEVGLWNELVFPNLSEEHFTRKYPALPTHHILEQAELSRQQINRAAASLGRAFDKIELKRSTCSFVSGVSTARLARASINALSSTPP